MMLQDHSVTLDAPVRRLRSRGRWPALALAVAMLTTLFTVAVPNQARADSPRWLPQLNSPAVGTEPAAMAVTPDGAKTYVTNGDGSVWVLDNSVSGGYSWQVDGSIGDGAEGVAVAPDGAHAYVTVGSAGVVRVIDTATDEVVDSYAVGNSPYGIAIAPDSSKAYVALTGSGLLAVLNLSTGLVESTIAVGPYPRHVAVTPDGSRVYVTNSDDTISAVDTATHEVSTISFGGFGTDPADVVVSLDGAWVYVPLRGGARVVKISVDTGTVDTLTTEVLRPESVAVAVDGSRIYVVDTDISSGYGVIYEFSPTGEMLGLSAVDTDTAYDVAVGGEGLWQVLVSNPGSGHVSYFDGSVTPTFEAATLPDGKVGVPYNYQIPVTGIPLPTSIGWWAGNFPSWMNIDWSTRTLTGTPSAAGTSSSFAFYFPSRATPAQYFTVTVSGAPTIDTESLPDAAKGVAYSQQIVAFGDPAPTFEVSDGALSTGLTLSEEGLLEGTPTGATSTFEVKATNTAGFDAKYYTLTVNTAPAITTTLLPAATQGVAYSQQLVATGDPAPTFSVTSGTLPTGLTLSSTGLLDGTPTGATATFEVTATNAAGTDAKTYTLTVKLPPPAKATGVTVKGGMQQAFVSWTPSADDPGSGFSYTVTILQHLNIFSCTTTGTWCVVTGLAAGPVTASVIATGPTGSSSAETGTGTVLARTDAPPTPPAGQQGGVSVEFRDRAGQVVTETAPGQVLTVTADGFAEGSLVDVFAYSAPQHLGSGVANASGTATFNVTIPKDLAAGAHTLVAFGLNGTGAAASASVKVRVTEPDDLSDTGSNDGWLLYGAALLLGSGVVLLRRARRRATVS